jgi:DNA-binding transcriptional LysR family regulator
MINMSNMQDIHFRNLDLNLLRALDMLLEERNVTRAAERLGLTQPAMSHALARLRGHFGDPLLVRVPGGVKPTPRAAAMAVPLHQAISAVARAVSDPTAFDPARATRSFTIATDDYLERILLPTLLRRLWKDAPGVDLRIVPVGMRPAEELAAGQTDLAISVAGVIGPLASIYTQSLFTERFLCAMRRGHPLAKKRRLTLDQFVSCPHALVAPGGRPSSVVDRALAKLGRKRRVAISIPHFLAAPAIVASSDVILTMGKRLAKAAGRDLHLTEAPLALSGFTVAMFWHERQQVDQAHQWLRMLVTDAARKI